jgi:hypothetical protein
MLDAEDAVAEITEDALQFATGCIAASSSA